MVETTDTLERINAIDFGMEAQAFLQGSIGRYLVRRANEEIEAAVEQLKKVPPENSSEIRTLQNIVSRAESIQFWLAEAIQAGALAEQELLETAD